MREATVEERIWMAGFVDGEGCIGISFSKPSADNRFLGRYDLAITVVQCHGNGLDLFVDIYGGVLSQHDRASRSATLYWKCPSSQRSRVLLDLLPYFRIKAAQANIALEFIALGPQRRRVSSDLVSVYNSNILRERSVLREKMRDLNQTGPGRKNLRLVV